ARAVAGHLRPGRLGDERERLDLPRVRRGLCGQGTAVSVARLAAVGLPRVLSRGSRSVIGGRLEGSRIRIPADRDLEVPGADFRLPEPASLACGVRVD